jgi:hypothetical protein
MDERPTLLARLGAILRSTALLPTARLKVWFSSTIFSFRTFPLPEFSGIVLAVLTAYVGAGAADQYWLYSPLLYVSMLAVIFVLGLWIHRHHEGASEKNSMIRGAVSAVCCLAACALGGGVFKVVTAHSPVIIARSQSQPAAKIQKVPINERSQHQPIRPAHTQEPAPPTPDVVYVYVRPTPSAAVARLLTNVTPTPFPVTFPSIWAEASPNPVLSGRPPTMHFRVAYALNNQSGQDISVASCSNFMLQYTTTDALIAAHNMREAYRSRKTPGCGDEYTPLANGQVGTEYVAQGDIFVPSYLAVEQHNLVLYYAGEISVRLASGDSERLDICGFTYGDEIYMCHVADGRHSPRAK